MAKVYTYSNLYAEMEGNNIDGWGVKNLVTGLGVPYREPKDEYDFDAYTFPTYKAAKSAYDYVTHRYRAIAKAAGWDGWR